MTENLWASIQEILPFLLTRGLLCIVALIKSIIICVRVRSRDRIHYIRRVLVTSALLRVDPDSIDNEDASRIICLDTVIAGEDEYQEKTVRLFCGHIFHDSCITSWFDRSLTCPNCRVAAQARLV